MTLYEYLNLNPLIALVGCILLAMLGLAALLVVDNAMGNRARCKLNEKVRKDRPQTYCEFGPGTDIPAAPPVWIPFRYDAAEDQGLWVDEAKDWEYVRLAFPALTDAELLRAPYLGNQGGGPERFGKPPEAGETTLEDFIESHKMVLPPRQRKADQA